MESAQFSYFQTAISFFLLLTPFFGLLMFLCYLGDTPEQRRRSIATKIGISSFIFCVLIIFFGDMIFSVLGITLDAFRIGVGTILLLDAISLVRGKPAQSDEESTDIVIVPMTIPVIVGPGTLGTLMVRTMEMESINAKLQLVVSLFMACFAIWLILYLSTLIERFIGIKRIIILSKLTGIYLAALASQMIIQGAKAGLGL